jgi:hypothetical protein
MHGSGGLGQQTLEFKDMVKAFHQAGLEVILDVVFNHTAEGNEVGPTIGFCGLDNVIFDICRFMARWISSHLRRSVVGLPFQLRTLLRSPCDA